MTVKRLWVYLKKNDDVEGPSKALRAFKRVHIPAGKTVDVSLIWAIKSWCGGIRKSNTMCVSEGSYELMVGGSSQLLVCCAGLLSFSLDTSLTKSKRKFRLRVSYDPQAEFYILGIHVLNNP